MIKFLAIPVKGNPYLINVRGPKEFKKFLQKITRPQNNPVAGRRETITSASIPPSWKQIIKQVVRYTTVYSLIYYNPNTKTLLYISNHDFIHRMKNPISQKCRQQW